MDAFSCDLRVLDKRVYYCEDWSWRAPVFRDRWDAGEALAGLLGLLVERGLWPRPGMVYAVPAGGVPVGIVVSERLGAGLDLVVVKKVTFPWTTEAGFGAVAPDGRPVLDPEAAGWLGAEAVERQVRLAYERVLERLEKLRGGAGYPRLDGETVLVVDDGIAAGWTMAAAVGFLRGLGASRVYAAAPTGSVDGSRRVALYSDGVAVVNLRGGPYYAVADAYIEWRDLGDEEVLEMLRGAGWRPPRRG